MSSQFRHIIPVPQPEIEETFAAYDVTNKFYQEVQTRQALKSHCDWYRTTAERHRQELQQMRGELNILRWFRWRR